MGKLKKGGEDTRGLKAKQQKAQARQEKESVRAAAKKAQEGKTTLEEEVQTLPHSIASLL